MKRWAIRIGVLLALGAIVNVAVAWGLAVWGPPVATAARNDGAWRSDIVDWWTRVAPAEYGPTPLQTKSAHSFGYASISASGKRSRFEQHSLDVERRQYGWPKRGTECTCWRERPAPTSAYQKVHGIQFQMKDQTMRVLPTVILYKPFAINTIFYAAIMWLLFFAPFALRRRRRIKRGLCMKCGYDPRGRAPQSTVCPECGAAAI